jgi:hypothetical protein
MIYTSLPASCADVIRNSTAEIHVIKHFNQLAHESSVEKKLLRYDMRSALRSVVNIKSNARCVALVVCNKFPLMKKALTRILIRLESIHEGSR